MAQGRSRGPLRAVLHFVSSVLMVSGALLIADAGVTLAWQEPISKFMADQQQQKLETQLEDPPRRVIERMPLAGDAIARIDMPEIDKQSFVVEGTDTESLRKGPGHYPETPLPGERGTVGIAGHRTTYGAPFRDIDQLDVRPLHQVVVVGFVPLPPEGLSRLLHPLFVASGNGHHPRPRIDIEKVRYLPLGV